MNHSQCTMGYYKILIKFWYFFMNELNVVCHLGRFSMGNWPCNTKIDLSITNISAYHFLKCSHRHKCFILSNISFHFGRFLWHWPDCPLCINEKDTEFGSYFCFIWIFIHNGRINDECITVWIWTPCQLFICRMNFSYLFVFFFEVHELHFNETHYIYISTLFIIFNLETVLELLTSN